jgi:uncharacterized Zn finger protein
MSYYDYFPAYVSVAERRLRAEREVAKLKKRGQAIAPVTIEGRKIAKSFWGESWCTNLERYSDYANRLPRGRTYVRNGSVVDLQIAEGQITALVAGSDLYRIKITIAPVGNARWKGICRDCSGTIDSLVELLQGRLDKGVMERMCREGDGLFPAPNEIKLSCSCPDSVGMCKHLAAALYGVGARLDHAPEHLFLLRGVDQNELIAGIGESFPLPAAPASAKVLDDGDVAALFGIDMGETPGPDALPAPEPAKRSTAGKRRASQAKTPASRHGSLPGTPKPRSSARAPTRSKRARRGRASMLGSDG